MAALRQVPEECLALLITEAPQAVRALKVTLTSMGYADMPTLCRKFHLLGPRLRPPSTRCHMLQCIHL